MSVMSRGCLCPFSYALFVLSVESVVKYTVILPVECVCIHIFYCICGSKRLIELTAW
jgi:hypothetical protein